MKKLLLITIFLFLTVTPVQAKSVDELLAEYKDQYAAWKKEQVIKAKVEELVKVYPNENKDNQKYIARQFLVNFDYGTAQTALAVSYRESGFGSKKTNFNTNKTWDKGCWQINDCHGLSDTVRFNCKKSTDWAVNKVRQNGGFGIWVAYTKYIKNDL